MISTILKGALPIVISLVCISFELPVGWVKAGSHPDSYDMGIDLGAGKDSSNAGTIKSIDKDIDGFGTLMQKCRPDKFIDKRVKMTGYLKSENVVDGASFWFRVDQLGSKEELSFDNMEDRPIVGTTDWHRYELVLDVPNNASYIAYGAMIGGTGQIWFDNITFEIVDETVPTTGSVNGKKSSVKLAPVNLDFEK